MKILDCETIDSTYESLTNILNISKDEINNFFKEFKFENKNSADTEIFESFQKKYSINISYNGTYFFHASRCDDIKRYEKGILPLNEIIDEVWSFLYSLIKEIFDQQEWKKFRDELENGLKCSGGFTYRLRVKDSFHWGPDAFLIKEVIFKLKELGQHNYLKIPEIVEDICRCFEEKYKIDLLQAYIKKTDPCIIKFKTSNNDQKYIATAILYLYEKFNNMDISSDCCNANPKDEKRIASTDICWIKKV
jgi:hypothetical protein